MGKLKRNERIAGLVKILIENPSKIFTFNYFSELFDAAKSTLSEDIVIIKKAMEELDLGKVETIPGASGGVKYIPYMSKLETERALTDICKRLMEKNRIIAGSFLYMADIIYNPEYVRQMGQIFATCFSGKSIDYVVTIETKGIPLALMTANAINVPLVIVRNENKVTEGSTVSMNYVSGSTGEIRNMYVSKRSLSSGSRVLIIDDFMKAGGTIKGVVDLMGEFDAKVEGIGVMMATVEPRKKLVERYTPLILLEKVAGDEIIVYPNEEIFKKI